MASLHLKSGPAPAQKFRSWGEAQIGRMLNRFGVPYMYEHPLAVIDDGKTRIWYPDFQLRDYGILIEYCGMPDDPAYRAGMVKKRDVYEANGLAALMFTPDLFRRDWPAKVLSRIESVLRDRLESIRATGSYHSISRASEERRSLSQSPCIRTSRSHLSESAGGRRTTLR